LSVSSRWIDLHCHSTASDGTLAPQEVVRLAVRNGLSALSLTDHDTIAGTAEAASEAARVGIDFIPGIEISATFPSPGTLHILGYGVDPQSPVLQELTRQLLEGRDTRNPRIVARLRELGIAISMEEVEQEAGGNVVGRPHIAAILMRKGYVSSIKEAFNKYLAEGGLAYFDKERLAPQRALELIDRSGGLAVLAHPVQLRCENDSQLEGRVKDLVDLGLAGIEVIHSDHDAAWVGRCTCLAERYSLLKTGGSDFHGRNKAAIDLGTANGRRIPREFFDELVAKIHSRRVRTPPGAPG
jgi:predicted metal-dependent phosphoesterase TrpH